MTFMLSQRDNDGGMIQQRDPRRGTRENDGANKEELTLFPGGIALEETLLLYPFFHNRAFYSIMHRMNEKSAEALQT